VNWDRFNDLKLIHAPTLVTSGTDDRIDPAYVAAMAM
jgi:pimeloyl-ACP methyl ester carboxylesterase